MVSLPDEIDELQIENQSVEEKIGDYIRRQRAKDQSRIAWVIIWAFVATIAGLFLLVVLGSGLVPGARTEWKEPAQFLAEIVSSVLLPIVTLVLGFYFGKEKTE